MHWGLLILAQQVAVSAVHIWPQPSNVTRGEDVLWLDPRVLSTLICLGQTITKQTDRHAAHFARQVSYSRDAETGQDNWRVSGSDDIPVARRDGTLLTEFECFQYALVDAISSAQTTRFVPWKLHPKHAEFEPRKGKTVDRLSTLDIYQEGCNVFDDEPLKPKDYFSGDESYEIVVDETGAQIYSRSTIGTLRALETFKQLFYWHSDYEESYIPNIPLHIGDTPKWKHRGLSLDIARNPFTVQDVIKTIDVMATAKLSRLHIHATDSQSWPLEIVRLPELARQGAYRRHLIFTAIDVFDVQLHGAKKGVSVFLELDMPGHTASIAHAYPELVAAFNETDWSTFADEPPSGQLKLNSSNVTRFVDQVVSELLPRMAPFTNLYHLGGDEFNTKVHLLDETVNSDDSTVLQPLLQSFYSNIVRQSLDKGFQPIVWEEVILDWNLTMPSSIRDGGEIDTLVQVWRNSERIVEVLERGHRVVFGDHSHWYLDCGYGVFLDPYPSGKSPVGVPYNTSGGRRSRLKAPYLDYCGPYHNWRHILMYNPLKGVKSDLHHLIEGGEVLLWSEQTDSIDLDFKLWPRAAAAAEVLWSGPRNESILEDAARRLAVWRERAVIDLGIHCSPVHMSWCLMERGCNW